jgi:GT2 family glycosyltransferase
MREHIPPHRSSGGADLLHGILTYMDPQLSTVESPTPGRPQAMSVGVLVLNYNTWDIALRAIGAAVELEHPAITEFVLFDDGSPAPPPENIDSRIRVILGKPNRGFGGALVEAFAQMQSDIVVLFDSDAFPLVPFSAAVRRHFEEDSRLGQIGFLAQDEHGSPTESQIREPSKWSLILGQALYARAPHGPIQPSNLCVITGCMATRMTAYREIGGIDPNFDMLDIDLDYSMRMRRNRWKVISDLSIRVFHVGGGTPQLQRHRLLRFYKSRWYLLRKHELIRNAALSRAVILMRLRLEKLILQLFGRFLYSKQEILTDKLVGRQNLIAYCSENYL